MSGRLMITRLNVWLRVSHLARRSKGEPTLITKMLLVSVLCSTATAIGCSRSARPSDTLTKYFQLIDKGDIDGPLNLLSKQERGAELTAKAEVVLLIGVLHDSGGLKSIDILKENLDGDSARVNAKLSYNNGKSEEVDYKLVKENDEWKMDDLYFTVNR
jgi:hypothetical protein